VTIFQPVPAPVYGKKPAKSRCVYVNNYISFLKLIHNYPQSGFKDTLYRVFLLKLNPATTREPFHSQNDETNRTVEFLQPYPVDTTDGTA
jgi:hypothetical protein